MALDSLLASKRDKFVTSVTSCNVADVTRKTAPILDVTPVTSVTPETNKVQIKKSVNQDDGKSQDLKIIRQWMLDGGRPSNDYLFRLIIDKCEKDEVARKRFVQEAQATKAKLRSNAEAAKQPIVNEKVVQLSDRDDRHYCKNCSLFKPRE